MKLYQERDFGEKINATFSFLRQNISQLGKSLLYIAGPAVLVVGIVSALSVSDIIFNDTPSVEEAMSLMGGSSLAGLLSLLSMPLVIGVVYGYMKVYFESESPKDINISDVWSNTKRYFLPILISIVAMFVVVLIGFFFLIVPGFLLLSALSFIFIILVKEDVSFGEAFSRCFRIVSDHYLSTLGLLLVVLILQSILASVFSLPLMVFTGVGAFFSSSGDIDTENSSTVVQALIIVFQVVGTLGGQFLYAISLVAIAFQYGNLVEKKESAGLMEEIDTLGTESSTEYEDEQY